MGKKEEELVSNRDKGRGPSNVLFTNSKGREGLMESVVTTFNAEDTEQEENGEMVPISSDGSRWAARRMVQSHKPGFRVSPHHSLVAVLCTT